MNTTARTAWPRVPWSPALDAAVHRGFAKNVTVRPRESGWLAWSDRTPRDHLGRVRCPYRLTPAACSCPAGVAHPVRVCCHRARLLLDLDLIVLPRRDRPFAATAAD